MKKTGKQKKESPSKKTDRNVKIILVAIALILTFIVVYYPHFQNKYPIHEDEWHHINEAERIVNNDVRTDGAAKWSGLERIVQYVLVALDKLSVNLVLSYKYLPAIAASFAALALFFFLFKKSNYWVGLIGILFFSTLKSNINILGLWFFTPLTLAIPFIFLFFYFFTEAVESANSADQTYYKRSLYISFVLFLFILLLHPISATFTLPILAIYLLINHKFVKQNKIIFILLLAIPIIGIIYFVEFLWQGSLAQSIVFTTNTMMFKSGWGQMEILYYLPLFYSMIATILALIGVYFALQDKKQRIFVIWPLLCLFMLWFFNKFSFSLFAPYQRYVYYTLLGLIPLSAIGLYHLLDFLRIILNKIVSNTKTKKIVFGCSVIVILFLIFYNIYSSEYKVSGVETGINQFINDNDYRALKFLKEYSGGKVIAPLGISSAVYPISRHETLATLYFYGDASERNAVKAFYASDCSVKETIIRDMKISYVLSKDRIDCGYREIYNDGEFIYKV